MPTAPITVPTAPSATQSATATKSTSDAAASNALGKLGPDAFLKLLVAQLKYQNPFNPSDPSAMLGQVAMFTQVESLQKIQAGQTTSQTLEQARMAGEVIGKQVTGKDSLGATSAGVVSSARFTPSGPILVLSSGKEMPLASVETIGAPTAPTPAPTPAATPAPTPAATPAPTPAPTPAAAAPATKSSTPVTSSTVSDTVTNSSSTSNTATSSSSAKAAPTSKSPSNSTTQ